MLFQTTASAMNQQSSRVWQTRHGTGRSAFRRSGCVTVTQTVWMGRTKTQRHSTVLWLSVAAQISSRAETDGASIADGYVTMTTIAVTAQTRARNVTRSTRRVPPVNLHAKTLSASGTRTGATTRTTVVIIQTNSGVRDVETRPRARIPPSSDVLTVSA